MRICFHGTDEESADSIRAEGFRIGTYFAAHLEDALAMGGPFVFFVSFDEGKFNPGDPGDEWQFHVREVIPPDKIWKLIRYDQERLMFNPSVVS